MYRVKTFGIELEVFHAHRELEELDRQVNEFFGQHPGYRLVGASDTPLADEDGCTRGIIRVVSYEE